MERHLTTIRRAPCQTNIGTTLMNEVIATRARIQISFATNDKQVNYAKTEGIQLTSVDIVDNSIVYIVP